MEIKKYLLASAASLACAAFGAYLYSRHAAAQSVATPVAIPAQTVINAPSAPTDFTAAAELTVNGVAVCPYSLSTEGIKMYIGE